MREQSHSANIENTVNHDVDKVDKLQQEFNELQKILYTHVLQNSATVTMKMLTTTTGFLKTKTGTKQIASAKFRQLYPTREYNLLNMLVRAKIRQRL